MYLIEDNPNCLRPKYNYRGQSKLSTLLKLSNIEKIQMSTL
jgi:flagellar assembly factor FliW